MADGGHVSVCGTASPKGVTWRRGIGGIARGTQRAEPVELAEPRVSYPSLWVQLEEPLAARVPGSLHVPLPVQSAGMSCPPGLPESRVQP